MMKIFLTVLVIAGGITDATHNCSLHANEACPFTNMPRGFPETEEEFTKFCDAAIQRLQCLIIFEEHCHHEPDSLKLAYKALSVIQEVCDENSLLHAAIVSNLKCFGDLIEESSPECYIAFPSEERLEQLAQALIDEELTTLTDMGNETYSMCLRKLHSVACESVTIEKRCGTIAMDAFVEIFQKVAPLGIQGCSEEIGRWLPTVIRVYKLEEEKEERDVEQASEKK